jgi:hypothetical protein
MTCERRPYFSNKRSQSPKRDQHGVARLCKRKSLPPTIGSASPKASSPDGPPYLAPEPCQRSFLIAQYRWASRHSSTATIKRGRSWKAFRAVGSVRAHRILPFPRTVSGARREWGNNVGRDFHDAAGSRSTPGRKRASSVGQVPKVCSASWDQRSPSECRSSSKSVSLTALHKMVCRVPAEAAGASPERVGRKVAFAGTVTRLASVWRAFA